MVVLSVAWGFFQMDIKILNNLEANFKHIGSSERGNYAHTYCGKFYQDKIAIKCIHLRNESTRHKAVKEWFLLKVASAAEIGPKVKPYFGFDILMFKECI